MTCRLPRASSSRTFFSAAGTVLAHVIGDVSGLEILAWTSVMTPAFPVGGTGQSKPARWLPDVKGNPICCLCGIPCFQARVQDSAGSAAALAASVPGLTASPVQAAGREGSSCVRIRPRPPLLSSLPYAEISTQVLWCASNLYFLLGAHKRPDKSPSLLPGEQY